MDFSFGNTLSKGSVYESDSILGAWQHDARSHLADGARPEAISNEEIHKGDEILETYRVEDERPGLTEKWNEYNACLKKKCEEVGALYVDIATPLRNEKGFLPMEWSHDSQYHLNDEGNAIWVQTLLDYAQSRYDAGLWSPEKGGY